MITWRVKKKNVRKPSTVIPLLSFTSKWPAWESQWSGLYLYLCLFVHWTWRSICIWICILRPVIHNSCLAAVAGPLQCCSRMSLGWKYSKCYPCVCTNCSKQTHPSNIPGDVCRGDACISIGPEPEDRKPETSKVPLTSHGFWLAGIVEPSKSVKKTSKPSKAVKNHQKPSKSHQEPPEPTSHGCWLVEAVEPRNLFSGSCTFSPRCTPTQHGLWEELLVFWEGV